jgi:hypothetical protein
LTRSLVKKDIPNYPRLTTFAEELSKLILASIKRWKEEILKEARKCIPGKAIPLNKASQEAEAGGSGSGSGSGIRNGVEVTGGVKSKAAAPLNEDSQEVEASGSDSGSESESGIRDGTEVVGGAKAEAVDMYDTALR